MKFIRIIFKLSILILGAIGIFGCKSAKELQNSIPFVIEEVYYKHWFSGVKNGGSGIDLFIKIESKPNSIILDSIYFRGQQTKLKITNNNLFVGRFLANPNPKKDIIMSNKPYAEYGNKTTELTKEIPFKLKPDECVISYKQGFKTKHFKIVGLTKKQNENI